MKYGKYAMLLLLTLVSLAAFAQDKPPKKKKFLKVPADKAIFEQAELLFLEKNYKQALAEYQKLEVNYPEEEILIFRIGVCYLYQVDGLEKSLEYLLRLDQEKFKKTDLCYYLGRAYHMNTKFVEAIAQFEKFMVLRSADKERKEEVQEYIKNCENGKILFQTPVNVNITNIGKPVNTENSEYVPVISSDEEVMIFTYRGERSTGGRQIVPGKPSENGDYFEDIFITYKDSNGNWVNPEPLGNNINTEGHDACIALSADGQKLFIFKNTLQDIGVIYMSRLDGKEWSEPELMKGGVESPAWEGSVSMSNDERTIYFSSEREGGFGGKDIYKATLQDDGTWGDVQNLGIEINTEYDDDAPFIHPSGLFLVFSSKGHNSMGGYDIFRSDLKDSAWGEPFNVGYPINTPGDDIYYVLAADGQRGYYASGKQGGYGKQDIYLLEPGNLGRKIVMVQVKGQVTIDDKPVKAQIKVQYKDSTVQGIYRANSATGKYLINLPADKYYIMTFTIPDSDKQIRVINTVGVDSFIQADVDVQFYTPEYLAKLKAKKDSLLLISKANDSLAIKTTAPLTLNELKEQYGNASLEGLTFTVQIGAYNLPQNFNYAKVLRLGKVKKQKLDDNVTRFTMGEFKTLNDAYAYKDKIVEAGVSDAFVTAIYQGKRYLIKDLAENNFFKK
ncbi:MAG: hypothetical protein AB1458_16320 [Bacteroidota bacterium]